MDIKWLVWRHHSQGSTRLLAWTFLLMTGFGAPGIWAKGAVSSLSTSTQPAPDFSYTGADGAVYNWGLGDDLLFDGFSYNGESYLYYNKADQVVVRRSTSAEPCSIFVETIGVAHRFKPEFPGGCDLAEELGGRILNRGALDLFLNQGGAAAKNIERVDFIFTDGITAPTNVLDLARAGHVATEKSGNNSVKIAAITALSGGVPSSFGPLVEVKPNGCAAAEICYGMVGGSMDFEFLHTDAGSEPIQIGSSIEQMGVAFVSLEDLGVSAGQIYYGFSYFGADVPPAQDLVDWMSFPTDTGTVDGDADLYGGTAEYFLASSLFPMLKAVDDSAATQENTPVTIGVLSNDEAVESAVVSIIALPSHGQATVNANRSVTYTPNPGFTGPTDSFTYQLKGLNGDTVTAAVRVAISAAGPDTDGDGVPDADDIDDDNDGILDSEEGTGDFDGDGVVNRLDLESDGDGINDFEESGLREAQQATLDSDGDGRIDATQSFGSNGLADALESQPGFPDYSGSGQAEKPVDSDSDHHADFLDLDADNDGIHDVIEAGFDDSNRDGRLGSGAAPTNTPKDTDRDGVADYRDLDTDNDGLADVLEAGAPDSNGDARIDNFSDGNADGYDDRLSPTPLPIPDTDGDGLRDFRDLDSDNDGLTDLIEAGGNDQAFTGRVAPWNDSNRDGMHDPLNSGTGGVALPVYDSDADGNADFRDLDSDADGRFDISEVGLDDADNDGHVDAFNDANADGYDDAAQASLRAAAVLPDQNANGVPDYREPACECTGPKFKTGLQGFGGGSMGGLMIPLALILAWRRKVNRSFPSAGYFAVMLLCFVGYVPVASAGADDAPLLPRWYIAAGLGYAHLEPEPACGCYRVEDETDLAGSLHLGVDLTQHLSVEGYYADLGAAKTQNRLGTDSGEIGYRHTGISGLVYFQPQHLGKAQTDLDERLRRRQGWAGYARLGVGNMRNHGNVDYQRVESVHAHLGLGAVYGWRNGLALRAEWVSYDQDASQFELAIVKRLGGKKKGVQRLSVRDLPPPLPEPASAPQDTDHDGVTDSLDHCPLTPSAAVVDAHGCQLPKLAPAELPTIYFSSDSAALSEAALQQLKTVAIWLQDNPRARLEIIGHTDDQGTRSANLDLSLSRARAVSNQLEAFGVASDRLQIMGLGEAAPVADNQAAAGRALNRRVELSVSFPEQE